MELIKQTRLIEQHEKELRNKNCLELLGKLRTIIDNQEYKNDYIHRPGFISGLGSLWYPSQYYTDCDELKDYISYVNEYEKHISISKTLDKQVNHISTIVDTKNEKVLYHLDKRIPKW